MKLLKSFKRKQRQKNDGVAKRAARHYKKAVVKGVVNEVVTCKETCTNLTAMYLTAIRRVCGFGEKRLKQIVDKAGLTASCFKEGYITTRDIIETLYEETGFKMVEMYNPKKNYVSRVDSGIDIWTDKITAIIMLALHDVFDFGKKRLVRVHQACAALGKEMVEGKVHIKDLTDELKKVNIICV